MSRLTVLALVLWSLHVTANVEKVIFTAPDAQPKIQDASLDNLFLTTLSESYPSVRTYINASFPTNTSTKGTESWFLLDGLVPHRRYEVRICWAATQPTSFWLDTYMVNTAFSDASLISSLSTYSYLRHDQLTSKDVQTLKDRQHKHDPNQETTILFLQIFAAADYFSLNQTLMDVVPPVAIDLILDPYVFNVLPKSLIPTGLYLGLIGIFAWFASSWILRHLFSNNSSAIIPPSKKVD
ncbi:hypothetical protein LTR84_010819 [Exophiala bonariae]|uniref:Uncharacterized protein n=1 Tax=Exophiala bonariae TaxID=1690606 RepID=A0AAV9NL50_9EURO|nr:hypothetical protein LTR84_010819 [Exophiala bonariae]